MYQALGNDNKEGCSLFKEVTILKRGVLLKLRIYFKRILNF